MWVKKQQLGPDMEKQTGSKSGKEYIRLYIVTLLIKLMCKSTSCDMPGWMKHKLESRLLGEISITSDMQWRRQWQPTPILFLENPRDSKAWWAAVYGVIQSQTRLKQLSSSSSRYAYDTTLRAESKEELNSLLMKVKEESEKAGLKLNIQKTKVMESGPITLWQTNGEKIETVTDFIFFGFKITADNDCSHEMKRCLLL